MDPVTLGAAIGAAKKNLNNVVAPVSASDAGKIATVDSNGKYQAAALTVGQGEVAVDSTLLVSGAAADAKKTGDEIDGLKSALLVDESTTWGQGGFNVNTGGVNTSSTNRCMTNKFYLAKEESMTIKPGGMDYNIARYVPSTDAYVRYSSSWISDHNDIDVRFDSDYYIIVEVRTGSDNADITPSDVTATVTVHKSNILKLEGVVNSNKAEQGAEITNLESVTHNFLSAPLTWKTYKQSSDGSNRRKSYPVGNHGGRLIFLPGVNIPANFQCYILGYSNIADAISAYTPDVGMGSASADYTVSWFAPNANTVINLPVGYYFVFVLRSTTEGIDSGADASLFVELNEIENDAATNLIQQSKRPQNTSNQGWRSETPILSLLHFTDLHADTIRLANIVKFLDKNKTLINDAIVTGDIQNTYAYYNTFSDWWGQDYGTENIMTVIGNHDVYATSQFDESNIITQEQAFNIYMASWIANWDVTYTQGKTYYYKDYNDYGIRLIVLDAMLLDSDKATQIEWLASTLADAADDELSVIIAEHFPPYKYSEWQYVQCGFTEIDPNSLATSSCLQSAYQDAVQTFINNGGKFICFICGHTHKDYIVTTEDYPSQLFVVCGAAGLSAGNNWGSSVRVNGEKNADLFNIISFDTTNKLIKIVRVGCDTDRFLRKKSTLCINYETGTVISNNGN